MMKKLTIFLFILFFNLAQLSSMELNEITTNFKICNYEISNLKEYLKSLQVQKNSIEILLFYVSNFIQLNIANHLKLSYEKIFKKKSSCDKCELSVSDLIDINNKIQTLEDFISKSNEINDKCIEQSSLLSLLIHIYFFQFISDYRLDSKCESIELLEKLLVFYDQLYSYYLEFDNANPKNIEFEGYIHSLKEPQDQKKLLNGFKISKTQEVFL